MDVAEALDREVIIERAEELRFWLLGFGLSERATRAIQHELRAIIDNDPGGYINGRRPLAGLSSADFVAELYSTNGGAVGRVKNVGDLSLRELRAVIPPPGRGGKPRPVATTEVAEPSTVPAVAAALPVASPEVRAASEPLTLPAAATLPVVPPEAAPALEAAPTRRRPGRPKGSTKAARAAAEAARAAQAPSGALGVTTVALEQPAPAVPRRRGRPRRSATVAPGAVTAPALAAPAVLQLACDAGEGNDQTLSELKGLWPALHPHGRRAVMVYASLLLAEASLEA